jgi:hypothetical protein
MRKPHEAVNCVLIYDPYARQRYSTSGHEAPSVDLDAVYMVLAAISALTTGPNEHGVCDVAEAAVQAAVAGFMDSDDDVTEGNGTGAKPFEAAKLAIRQTCRLHLVRRIEARSRDPVLELTNAGFVWYWQSSREAGWEVLEGAEAPKGGETVVYERAIFVAEGAQVSAPITIADSIERSFIQIEQASGTDDGLKMLLKELGEAVISVSRETTEDVAAVLSSDFDVLAGELTKSQPRQRWYNLALRSLRDTANTLGAVGVPIVDLATKVAALLER